MPGIWLRFFTFSIADHTNFSESLVVTDALNLGSLRSVHIGLGRQTVRMEFGSDSSSYTLIIRDSGMLGAIKALLSGEHAAPWSLHPYAFFVGTFASRMMATVYSIVLNGVGCLILSVLRWMFMGMMFLGCAMATILLTV